MSKSEYARPGISFQTLEELAVCPVCGGPKHEVDVVGNTEFLVMTCSKCGLTTVSALDPVIVLPMDGNSGIGGGSGKHRKRRAHRRVF